MLDMSRKFEGERISRPYAASRGRGWRLRHTRADGTRTDYFYATEEAAKKARAELEGHINTITHTVETALAEWVEDCRKNGLRPATLVSYDACVRRFFPSPEGIALHGLREHDIQARYDALRSTCSVASHRQSLRIVKMFLTWCRRRKLIQGNPAEDVEGQGSPNKGKPQLRRDEARLLYAKCLEHGGDDRAVAVLLALTMGLRAGEIVGLTRRSLDDGGATLYIEQAKTAAGVRTLEVPAELVPLLNDRAAKREDLLPYATNWVRKASAKMAALAGVPFICPHGLRGTHATLATMAGATSQLVAGSLGHSSDAVTRAHYIDPREAERVAQRARMSVLAGGRR